MLSVADARACMLAATARLPDEHVDIDLAFGRVLARDIVATRSQPPFPASAMDGYAVRAADTPGALKCVGESAAGRAYTGAFRVGEAVRISTGAPVPEGADAIVLQEDAATDGDTVTAPATQSGRHIRPSGGDFAAGAVLLSAGRALDIAALTLAAAAGHGTLCVASRPRIALISGGDEIAAPGATPRPDQVFDSTRFGVRALVRAMGGVDTSVPQLPDDVRAIECAVAACLETADLVVMIGGASVGPHDHARAAVAAHGAQFLVQKVSVRPGKPTWFATVCGKPILGLPGNPASALVTARIFLAPLLAAMQGASALETVVTTPARLSGALPENGPREHYLRAVTSIDGDGQVRVRPLEDQDSSLMTVAAAANALLVRPAGDPVREDGSVVSTMPFAARLF